MTSEILKQEFVEMFEKIQLNKGLTADSAMIYYRALDDIERLKRELKKSDEIIKDQRDQIGEIQSKFENQCGEIEKLTKQLSDIENREARCSQLESDNRIERLKTEHYKDRVKDYKQMFDQVFRNVEIRKSIFNDRSLTRPNEEQS